MAEVIEMMEEHSYGLLGERLSHSFSPQIHAKLGNRDYGLFSVPAERLDQFLSERPFSGINVTIPYKKAVIPYLSEISPRAKEIGSVNTIVKRADGTLSGFNTDYAGMLYALRRAGISLQGRKVLILGSGGTSLTAQAVAENNGAREIVVVSRTGEINYTNVSEKHADAEIVINTTPVGMFPGNGEKPVDLSDFPGLLGVMDVIYNPFLTALLLDAQSLGISFTSGLPMLVAQAKVASDLFFGKVSSEDERATLSAGEPATEKEWKKDPDIERIIDGLYRELSNVILVGMPSSGKSSIGRLLSEKLGKPFLDLDTMIEEQFGETIPQIFAEEGEAGFRDKETLCAKAAGKERGTVIACGGGTVLREENVRALRQNGRVVLLERELSLLSTEGRPLSRDSETLKRMYQERLPFYLRSAEFTVKNNETTEACAEEILQTLRYEKEQRKDHV